MLLMMMLMLIYSFCGGLPPPGQVHFRRRRQIWGVAVGDLIFLVAPQTNQQETGKMLHVFFEILAHDIRNGANRHEALFVNRRRRRRKHLQKHLHHLVGEGFHPLPKLAGHHLHKCSTYSAQAEAKAGNRRGWEQSAVREPDPT